MGEEGILLWMWGMRAMLLHNVDKCGLRVDFIFFHKFYFEDNHAVRHSAY